MSPTLKYSKGFSTTTHTMLTVAFLLCILTGAGATDEQRTAIVDLVAKDFDAPAIFYVNQKRVGENAVTIELPYGEHHLEVRSVGCEPYSRVLVVRENVVHVEVRAAEASKARVVESESQQITMARQKGSLLVISQPPGLPVSIEGRTARTTVEIHDVAAGTVTVIVDNVKVVAEVAGEFRTTIEYDQASGRAQVKYPEAVQKLLFERYTEGAISAVIAMDHESMRSFWGRLERIGKGEGAWEPLKPKLVAEFVRCATNRALDSVLCTAKVLSDEVAAKYEPKYRIAEDLAPSLSARIRASLETQEWESVLKWTKELLRLSTNSRTCKTVLSKPFIDCGHQSLQPRHPNRRKALALWYAARTLLDGINDRDLDGLQRNIAASMQRDLNGGVEQRAAAMDDLEYTIRCMGTLDFELANILISTIARDLASTDTRWLKRALKLHKPNPEQLRELGVAVRKGSECLGLEEAKRWTDSIKEMCVELAPYSDLAYAYAVRRERGRQASRMVFDTVITRHAGTEAAEIARREVQRIRLLDGLTSSWIPLLVGAFALWVVYWIQFSPKHVEHKARLMAVGRAMSLWVQGKTAKAWKCVCTVANDPNSGVFRWVREARRQWCSFRSIWLNAARPWKKEQLIGLPLKSLWVFAAENSLAYFLVLCCVDRHKSILENIGAFIGTSFWFYVVSMSGVVLLRRSFRQHERLLPVQLVPASSICLPALVLPKVYWMIVAAWWTAAGLEFGIAVYTEVKEKLKAPPLPSSPDKTASKPEVTRDPSPRQP